MITLMEASANFHQLLVRSCQQEVVIPRKSARDARAFRQRLYRLRDLYTSVAHNPDASALAAQLEFKIVGRHLYISPKDSELASQLLERIQ